MDRNLNKLIGSEFEFVGSDVAGKGESGLKIALKVFNFLDVLNEFAINSFLDVSSFSFPFCFSIFSLLALFVSSF